MISVGNSIFMNGDYNVWKVDQVLNISINYVPTGREPGYCRISDNSSNGLIYVPSASLKEIQVFNLRLQKPQNYRTT